MGESEQDTGLRLAAFEHLRRLRIARDHLTAAELKPGFVFQGQRIPLINPGRGIFKPRQMRFLLSIRTVFPQPGRRVWYDDQTQVHRQIFEGSDAVEYAFMGNDPNAADNRWLKEAAEHRVPIIYFVGVAPGRYHPLYPVYVAACEPKRLRARIVFGMPDEVSPTPPATVAERRYALRAVKQRLHQQLFREAVIAAYGERCAVSGLPEPLLLDAAHIIEDRHEALGQPVVPNGIPLSKIHHAAFDVHLIGIDPDYRIRVSERLRDLHDGPMLAVLTLDGGAIRLPARRNDWPDRDRLAQRFEQFKAAG